MSEISVANETITVSRKAFGEALANAFGTGADDERARLAELLLAMRNSAVANQSHPQFIAGLTAAYEGICKPGITPDYLERSE
jgi:hypothetical protein